MSISAITSNALSSAQDLAAVAGTSSRPSATDTKCNPGTGGSSAHVSRIGQFLSKLDSLATTDPEKFKQLTADIAEKLKDAASGATGTDAERLSDLASKFSSASEAGTTDAIQPPEPPSQRHLEAYAGQQMQGGSSAEHHHGPSGTMKQTMDEIFSLVDQA